MCHHELRTINPRPYLNPEQARSEVAAIESRLRSTEEEREKTFFLNFDKKAKLKAEIQQLQV